MFLEEIGECLLIQKEPIIKCDFILQVSFQVKVLEGYVRAFFDRGTLGNRGRFERGRGKFHRFPRERVQQVHNAHNGNGDLQGLLSGCEGVTRGNVEEGGTISDEWWVHRDD